MNSRFFIERPIFAAVVAIIIALAGVLVLVFAGSSLFGGGGKKAARAGIHRTHMRVQKIVRID